ncbi:galectin-4-like [Bacillus rossius redtenbacheri]|uniref:galectin-4-like n=1 Tax=Bacillus rossius redtenbacheri TaxID=93214 RepID=UPI002FDE9085
MVWLGECCGGELIGGDGVVGRSRFYCCRDMASGDGEVEQAQEADKFEVVRQFSTCKTVSSPPVPYSGEIPVILHTGRTITIKGSILPDATRMSINLVCGCSEDSDLALHLNPRFDLDQVVRNSRVAGRWGDEEVAALTKNPLRRGAAFVIAIFVAEEEFLISLNGRHFCSYSFRVPLQRVVSLAIHGDVRVDSLDHGAATSYPDPALGDFVRQLPLARSADDESMETPFFGVLSHPFGPGTYLEVVAQLKLAPHSFYLNLQQGVRAWPHPSIALHVNPRFKAGPAPVVALNSWAEGRWGKERLAACLDFFPGLVFALRVTRRDDRFDVSINGNQFCSMKHKLSPDIVDSVVVQGDILIKDIIFEKDDSQDFSQA